MKKKQTAQASPQTFSQFIAQRDWEGARVTLEFQRQANEQPESDEWLAYLYLRTGANRQAAKWYSDALKKDNSRIDYKMGLALSLFAEGNYQEAEKTVREGGFDLGALQNRLLMHIAAKGTDEQKLVSFHQKLSDTIEDQLSLASIHYQRGHYQEAIDIYKRVLIEHREYIALNVYIAMCYYKLEYYDVALEVLQGYFQNFAKSPNTVNLRACCQLKMYDGKVAEAEVKKLSEGEYYKSRDIIKHNLVVFRDGDNALQILPPLLNKIPEASLNLVVYYLRNEEFDEAYNMVKDMEPATPSEYTLKAVAFSAYGQQHGLKDQLKLAQQCFQLVGASPTECDTIAGRQCMASCFFILEQYEDVLIYLNSIKSYLPNDDDFNWNFAIAKAMQNDYRGAEEAFSLIVNERYKADPIYQHWLAKCHIMNGNAFLAWELYLRMETSNESFNLLVLIANECYRMGEFFISAKAFDVLSRLDASPEYWVGKRGACIGVFQLFIAGEESREHLADVVEMLENSAQEIPQVQSVIRTIKRWVKENGHME